MQMTSPGTILWDEFREEGEEWTRCMYGLGITLARMRIKDVMMFNCR